jgi:hypothetical protein
MFGYTNLDVVLAETPRQREETFPMQEQDQGPVTCRTEQPAAVIFAERAAEAGSALSAPLFVP